jgi:translation elongation factor EF-Tu-like GTPase
VSDEQPFLLTIEDRHWVPDKGAVFVGYVERGTAQAGDLIQFFGPPEPITVPITSIDRPDRAGVIAEPGQLVAVLVDGVTREQYEGEIQVGHIIARAESLSLSERFQADLWITEPGRGGHPQGLSAEMESITIHLYGMSGMCRRITFQSDSGRLVPGQYATVVCEVFPLPVEVGTPIMVRVGARWVALGIVTAV